MALEGSDKDARLPAESCHGPSCHGEEAGAPGPELHNFGYSVKDREKQKILHRLNKVEGQIRGIKRMVEGNQYCVDILSQIAAAKSALNKVGMILLEDHTRGCVARAIREERGDEALDELMEILNQYVK